MSNVTMTKYAPKTPLEHALIDALAPIAPKHLALINESHGHALGQPESHFSLVVVSDAFASMRLIARHRLVYTYVHPYLSAGGGTIHALALHTYTSEEYNAQSVPDSPKCRGTH